MRLSSIVFFFVQVSSDHWHFLFSVFFFFAPAILFLVQLDSVAFFVSFRCIFCSHVGFRLQIQRFSSAEQSSKEFLGLSLSNLRLF